MNLIKMTLAALALTFAVSAVIPSLAIAQDTTTSDSDSGKGKSKEKAKGSGE